jgi:hypothetical protein
MKIQSLLVLAAMVGSADAANKRKRVFKIYSREDIEAADGVRSLQGGAGGKDQQAPVKEEPAVAASSMSISMSMTLAPSTSPVATIAAVTGTPTASPIVIETIVETTSGTTSISMSMKTMCSFCEGGVADPELPLVQGQTCGTVKAAVAMMDATNPNCAMAKQAEALCCSAAVDPAAPDTTAGAPEEVTTDTPPAPTPSTYDEPPSPTPPSPTPVT